MLVESAVAARKCFARRLQRRGQSINHSPFMLFSFTTIGLSSVCLGASNSQPQLREPRIASDFARARSKKSTTSE